MDLEKKVEKNTRPIGTLENAIGLLISLADSHTDQIEKMLFGFDELRASRKETEERIKMLVDAQIRSADAAKRLDKKMALSTQNLDARIAKSQEKLNEKMAELADVVKFAHERIDRIEQN